MCLPLQGRGINGTRLAEGHEGHVSQQQASSVYIICYAKVSALHLCSGALLVCPAPQVGCQLLSALHIRAEHIRCSWSFGSATTEGMLELSSRQHALGKQP